MKISKSVLTAFGAMFVVAGGLSAQVMSGTWSQNPVPLGQTSTLTLQSTVNVGLSTGCGYTSVRQGSPTGPIVSMPFICPAIFITVGPGSSYNWTFNQMGMAGQLPADTYYVEFNYNSASGISGPSFFPIRIDDPNTTNPPVLSSTGTGAIGTALNLSVSDPACATCTYIVAASLTTNVGLSTTAGHIALDNDVLFNLSYPTALPGLFNGFVGNLDVAGNSAGINVQVPNDPALIGLPLAFQAVLLDPTAAGGLSLSNPISRRVN